MPPIVALAVMGGISAGASIYGAHRQGSSMDKASRLQSQGLDKQLAFEQSNENRRRNEYDQQQKLLQSQWDTRQQNLMPYRQASANIVSKWTGQPLIAPIQQERIVPPYDPNTIGALAGKR